MSGCDHAVLRNVSVLLESREKKARQLRLVFVPLTRIRAPFEAGYNTTKRYGVTRSSQSQ